MLETSNLVKSYDRVEVLKSISFRVKKGTVFGFLGRNGAGKTTTMNILTGLIGYNSGEVKIAGRDIREEKEGIREIIGYLPESPVFYDYLTGREYLKFTGDLAGDSAGEIKTRSEELLEQVKLSGAADRKIGGYSRGMKQRLALAVALYNQPELLFLDEPTSALDPEGRKEMMELIERLKGSGITVFLSTHILSDVERVCDEVSILHEGRIIVTESLEKLKESFIQPVYDIELKEASPALIEELKGVEWVERVKTADAGREVSVYVRQIEGVGRKLLQRMAAQDAVVNSYQIRRGNLEDIFIRMVSRNYDNLDSGNLKNSSTPAGRAGGNSEDREKTSEGRADQTEEEKEKRRQGKGGSDNE